MASYFIEMAESESFLFDDGKLKTASFDTSQGFGLRGVVDEAVAYAHSSVLSEDSIKRAAKTIESIKTGISATIVDSIKPRNPNLYSEENPIGGLKFADKIKLLQEVDKYLRDKDNRVRQVSVSLSGEHQSVMVLRADGRIATDFRPLVRFNISVTVEDNKRMERGSNGVGGRAGYLEYISTDNWEKQADDALRQALGQPRIYPRPGW